MQDFDKKIRAALKTPHNISDEKLVEAAEKLRKEKEALRKQHEQDAKSMEEEKIELENANIDLEKQLKSAQLLIKELKEALENPPKEAKVIVVDKDDKSQEELIKIARQVFERYPGKKEIFICSDGTPFLDIHSTKSYKKTYQVAKIQNGKVVLENA